MEKRALVDPAPSFCTTTIDDGRSTILSPVLVARRYVVTGRVQRIGFRVFIEDAARREGVSGFVRNQHDGGVEIVAEGDLDAILRFERAVRRGPAGARVDDVQTIESEPSGRYAGFTVTG